MALQGKLKDSALKTVDFLHSVVDVGGIVIAVGSMAFPFVGLPIIDEISEARAKRIEMIEARKKYVSYFPRERILTVSARDYCECNGKNLSDYTMQNVSDFQQIPKNTEVIVGFDQTTYSQIIGTALIPKTRSVGEK